MSLKEKWTDKAPGFKDFRTSGLILAIPLTWIAIKLIELPDKTEAVWLAIGVVIGSFAQSIVEAFKDSPDPPAPSVTEATHVEALKIALSKTV